ncbi:VOC family protein [bacterium]|nr:VOC family protein [bacterium]
MAVKTQPDGFNTITPHLLVQDPEKQIEFLKQTFGAQEVELIKKEDGSVVHAEFRIGDSLVMLSQSSEKSPPMPCTLYVYVADADATYKKALASGADSLQEPADQFYGDRNAGVKDQCGNHWWIATHIEDVSAEEIQRRSTALAESKAQG